VRRAPFAVHATASRLQLSVGMQIDLERSTRLAQRVLSGDVFADDRLLEDLLDADFAEDLLPEWDEEWLTDHQSRYRQLRLTALEMMSGHLATAGQYGAAVQAALAAVQADSLRDSAHETLIRAYLAQGNRSDAFAHYGRYRRLLRDELGIDPPAELGRMLFSA
jgi:DNA-binding SARP family transcriptional activator